MINSLHTTVIFTAAKLKNLRSHENKLIKVFYLLRNRCGALLYIYAYLFWNLLLLFGQL